MASAPDSMRPTQRLTRRSGSVRLAEPRQWFRARAMCRANGRSLMAEASSRGACMLQPLQQDHQIIQQQDPEQEQQQRQQQQERQELPSWSSNIVPLVRRQVRKADGSVSANVSDSSSSSSSSGGGGRASGGGRSSGGAIVKGSPDAQRQLTADIMAARTWQQAGRVFEQASHQFNHIHTVALITRLSKLSTPRPPASLEAAQGRGPRATQPQQPAGSSSRSFPHHIGTSLPVEQKAGARAGAGAIHALPGLRQVPNGLQSGSGMDSQAGQASHAHSATHSSGDLSSPGAVTAWASATQRPVQWSGSAPAPLQPQRPFGGGDATQPSRRVHLYGGGGGVSAVPLQALGAGSGLQQRLSTTVWGSSSSGSSAALGSASMLPRGGAEAQEWLSFRSLMEELQVFAESMLHRMGARELANVTHGFVTMRMASRRFLQLVIAHSGRKFGDLKSQEAANLLWALAKAEHPPPQDWLQAFVSGPLTQLLPAMRNQELSNVVWALAKLQCHPGSAWLGAAVQELVRRHDSLLPQDVANALVGLAKLHWQPSAAQLHELLIAGLTNSAPRPLELTQMLWSIGEMHVTNRAPLQALEPALRIACTYLRQQAPTMAAAAPNHIASSVASLARIRYSPDGGTCTALMEAVQPHLHACTAQDLGDLVWGVAVLHKLGGPPPSLAWLQAVETACTLMLPSSLPCVLCRQIWAFAALCHKPGLAWQRLMRTQMLRSLPLFSEAEVAVSLWALAKLRVRLHPTGSTSGGQQIASAGSASLHHQTPSSSPQGVAASMYDSATATNISGVASAAAGLRKPAQPSAAPSTSYPARRNGLAGQDLSLIFSASSLQVARQEQGALHGTASGEEMMAWLEQMAAHLLGKVEGKQGREARRMAWRDKRSTQGSCPSDSSISASSALNGRHSSDGGGGGGEGSAGFSDACSPRNAAQGAGAGASASGAVFSTHSSSSGVRVGLAMTGREGASAGKDADSERRRVLARAAYHRLPFAQRLRWKLSKGGAEPAAAPRQRRGMGSAQRWRQQQRWRQWWLAQQQGRKSLPSPTQTQPSPPPQAQQQQTERQQQQGVSRVPLKSRIPHRRSERPRVVPSAGARCDLGSGPGTRLRHLALLLWAMPQLLQHPEDRHSFSLSIRPLLSRLAAASIQPMRVCAACCAPAGRDISASCGLSEVQQSPAPSCGPFTPSTLLLLAWGFAALHFLPSWHWLAAHRAACAALAPAFTSQQRRALRSAYKALHGAAVAQGQVAR